MKNKISLLSILSLLVIAGCNNKVSSSTNNSSSSNMITSSSEVSSSLKENEASILVEYFYSNGEYFGKYKEKGVVGEKYSIDSPKIDFMKADDEVVDFTLTSEGYYQKVVYDYSFEYVNDLSKGQDFSYFMVDRTRGVSFNYVISGNDSASNVIFDNNLFSISNFNLRMKDDNDYADFKYTQVVKSNFAYDNSLLSAKDNDVYVSMSFNVDGSVDIYKDGVLNYTYGSTLRPNYNKYGKNVYFKDLVDNVFEGIEDNGFNIGENNDYVKSLSIGYGLNKEDAKKLYEAKVHTQVKYVDEFDNEILERKSILDNGGTSYSYTTPSLNNFTYDKEVIEGITEKDKVEYVKYTFNGEEKITSEMKTNKSNVLNRKDTYEWASKEWFKVAQNLEGDFVVRVNYHLNGSASKVVSTDGGACCWRTNLSIIHDAATNDRYVSRLDWHGWMDDVNKDGKKIGTSMDNGTSYLDNYNYDIFGVYNDCEITETITRSGSKVTIERIIQPNKVGYKNRVYHHTAILQGVTSQKLHVSFGAEDAIVTFNSIKVID
jgi:hypothetical protein